jgi:hypothetical protein
MPRYNDPNNLSQVRDKQDGAFQLVDVRLALNKADGFLTTISGRQAQVAEQGTTWRKV